MKRLLALLLAYASAEAKSIVTDDYLDKVAMVESNFNFLAKGDNGKALGAWQMHQPAWEDSCNYMKFCRPNDEELIDTMKTNYKKWALDPVVSRSVARQYFLLLEDKMRKQKVKVTPISLYMAYNMGYSGASKFEFDHKAFWLDSKRKSILSRANHILSR
jgi:hypothetical protein